MPTVIAHHNVKDADHWLASPKRGEFLGPLGVTNIRTFVDPQDRTRVALLMRCSWTYPTLTPSWLRCRRRRRLPTRWRTTACCPRP